MQFFLLVLSLIFVFDAVRCQTPPNNIYNVPLLEFGPNPVPKSSLCSTPKCCPIALTFDDSPNWQADGPTNAIIDYLHSNNIPATFFINTKNWCDVETTPVAQESIKKMFEFGFNLGTHTVHHRDLTFLSATAIEDEIAGVQITLNRFVSPLRHISLFRAPYGAPYQSGTQGEIDRVSEVAAHAGYFHVGWQIEAFDGLCKDNITCVTDPIFKAIDAGRWGIIVLHSVWENTANALPSLFAGLRQRECELFTVEQFVHAKYGKSSAEVMDDFNRNSSLLALHLQGPHSKK
jgi:peptidoglycan/xylan/chitin deacetylase (PgdA/CDA1 family)